MKAAIILAAQAIATAECYADIVRVVGGSVQTCVLARLEPKARSTDKPAGRLVIVVLTEGAQFARRVTALSYSIEHLPHGASLTKRFWRQQEGRTEAQLSSDSCRTLVKNLNRGFARVSSALASIKTFRDAIRQRRMSESSEKIIFAFALLIEQEETLGFCEEAGLITGQIAFAVPHLLSTATLGVLAKPDRALR